MKEFNKKKFVYLLGGIGTIFMIMLFGYMYHFTIVSKVAVLTGFILGVLILFFTCILIYKRISSLKSNIENSSIDKKNNKVLLILPFLLGIMSFYLTYDYLIENKKEKEIKITEQVYLNYDNSKWKISTSEKEMFEIFLLKGRGSPRQTNILLMDNNDKSVSENMEYTKQAISTSGGKIVLSEEVKINGIDYYILSYSLLVDEKEIYISSFTTLSLNKNKVIVLKIHGIDKGAIDEDLNDFMNRIIIK